MYDNNTIEFLGFQSFADLIESIELINNQKEFIVKIALIKDEKCPYCNFEEINIHGSQVKKIKHSIHLGKPVILHYKSKRYKCKNCSKTFSGYNPFNGNKGNLSRDTTLLILEELKKYNQTYNSVAKMFNVSPTTVLNIFDSFVDIPRKKLSRIIALDEFYKGIQFDRKFCLTILDFETNKIIDIYPSRLKNDLISYFSNIPKEERDAVEFVIMDQYDTYRDLVRTYFPNSLIVIDLWHLLRNIRNVVKEIRIDLQKKLAKRTTISFEEVDGAIISPQKMRKGSDNWKYFLIKKYGYFLEFTPRKLSKEFDKKKYYTTLGAYYSIRDLVDIMLGLDSKLKSAYIAKEEFTDFLMSRKVIKNDQEHFNLELVKLDEELNDVLKNIKKTEIQEFNGFINSVINWKPEVINIMVRHKDYPKRRLTNGPIEGRNQVIKKIINLSNGYNNEKRFRNRIIYCINADEAISGPTKKEKYGRAVNKGKTYKK